MKLGLWWFARLFAKGKYVDGLWVGTREGGAKGDAVLRNVEEALCLIKRYDRRRYDRLLHDLERVWALVLPYGVGSFNASLDACQLDTRFVLAETSSPEVIASTIVHEATHARLRHCGIRYEQELRARVEAVCFRREIAFAAKLPNGRQARELAERSLEYYAVDYFWTDAEINRRHLEGAMEALRYLRMPEWLVRTMPALHALGLRIHGLTRSWRSGGRRRQ